jgi:hypothetical protein
LVLGKFAFNDITEVVDREMSWLHVLVGLIGLATTATYVGILANKEKLQTTRLLNAVIPLVFFISISLWILLRHTLESNANYQLQAVFAIVCLVALPAFLFSAGVASITTGNV